MLAVSRKKKRNSPSLMKSISKAIFLFFLITGLFLSLHADSRQCVWKDVDKIIAVGDIHGDYDNFVKILKAAGLLDDTLKWSGGKTHLVQTGDIMDRGDHSKDVFDLIKKLEIEAMEAGGRVHMLLGNHEEMNITGIVFRNPAYVSPKQFASFLPDYYRYAKEGEFLRQIQNSSTNENDSDTSLHEAYLETKWKELMSDKNIQTLYVNTFNAEYGRWIIEHNAVIKINGILFSHGGISERYAAWPMQKINDILRRELNEYRLSYKRGITPRMRREILYYPDSPLWNRDLALKDEKTYAPVVDKILKNFNATHMIIAHTPPGSPVIPEDDQDEVAMRSRFGQKVWMIDTGIADYYYGILSYLTIENGQYHMNEWRDEEIEKQEPFESSDISLLEESREDVEHYLLSAAVVSTNEGAVPGRTASWKVNLDDGVTRRRAMFKVIDDARPAALPESYKYELAAYALDKLLAFDRIPATIERKIDGANGSLQIRIENCLPLDDMQRKNITPPDSQAFANALEEINVFENLAYSERKELDDILIQEETWKIYRVDFSEAFSPTPHLIPEQKITRCSKIMFQNLKDVSDEVIRARLGMYINEKEIAALLIRKSLILKTLIKLIEEKGEATVLF
jgi:hypothetical protein